MIHDQTIKLVDEYIAMCERNMKASGNPYPGYDVEVRGILAGLQKSWAHLVVDRMEEAFPTRDEALP
jgi:hypothetical protein